MERLTSIQTVTESDGTTHEQILCFVHLWGSAFFKEGTRDYEEYLAIVKRLVEYEDLEEKGKMLKNPQELNGETSDWKFESIRHAHQQTRQRSMTELLFCMLRSGH